jgi:Interferon-induced transmembrane protein
MIENGNPPKNWLVESILITLFCCLPLGIVGIINAANVNSRWAAGDYAGAERAAAEAKKWTKIGFITGIVLIIGYVILWITIGAGFLFMGLNNMD